MKIKINNKNHKIRPATEMTVKEYIALFDGMGKELSGLEMLIRYISITTGLSYKNIADININEPTIRRLFAYVGEISQAKDMPEIKEFYYKKTAKTLYQKSLNWRTIGVRKLLEERKTENQLKLAVYLLAIYISKDYDNEKIEEIYQELQDYNAISVLSFVIFFFKKLHPGRKPDRSFLKMLKRKANINTAKQSSK
jgi:hypothetical protein